MNSKGNISLSYFKGEKRYKEKYNQDKIESNCEYCGKIFKGRRRIESKHYFCSRLCYHAWTRKSKKIQTKRKNK